MPMVPQPMWALGRGQPKRVEKHVPQAVLGSMEPLGIPRNSSSVPAVLPWPSALPRPRVALGGSLAEGVGSVGRGVQPCEVRLWQQADGVSSVYT